MRSLDIIDLDAEEEEVPLHHNIVRQDINEEESSVEFIEEVNKDSFNELCINNVLRFPAEEIINLDYEPSNTAPISKVDINNNIHAAVPCRQATADISREISMSFQNDTMLHTESYSETTNLETCTLPKQRLHSHSNNSSFLHILDDSSDEDLNFLHQLKTKQVTSTKSSFKKVKTNADISDRFISDDSMLHLNPCNVLSQGSELEGGKIPSSPRIPLSTNDGELCNSLNNQQKQKNDRPATEDKLDNFSILSKKLEIKPKTPHSSKLVRVNTDILNPTEKVGKKNRVLKRSDTDVPILDLLDGFEEPRRELSKRSSESVLFKPFARSESFLLGKADVDECHTHEYITNARHYSLEEFQETMKKFNKVPDLKRKFAEANKVNRKSEDLYEELIMDFNYKLYDDMEAHGLNLSNDILCGVKKNFETKEPIIYFKRKVKSIYDIDHNIYFPCVEKVIKEPFVILFYDSVDFFQLYKADKSDLIDNLKKLSKSYMRVIVILNEFQKLESSLKSLENKKYMKRVRSPSESIETARRTSKKDQELEKLGLAAEDMHSHATEVALIADVHVFPMINHSNFIEWTKSIILNICRCRYDTALRNAEYANLHVKSGQSPKDVFEKALEQFSLVTSAKSKRVSAIYPSFQSLFRNITRLRDGPDGKSLMPPSSLDAIKMLFHSNDPDELVYK